MRKHIKIDDVKPGDLIDLENDPFADSDHGNDFLVWGYVTVEEVVNEGLSSISEGRDVIAVTFQDFDTIGFPAGHNVTRFIP